MSNYDEVKKQEVIELIKSIISSRIELTTHREIAAWTITAFYITIIFAVYGYIKTENLCLTLPLLIVIILSTFVFFFIILCFVHSQYGAHVSSRAEYFICVKKLFEIINGDTELNHDICKIEGDNTFYPKFLEDDINEITEEAHKISNIGPCVIYKWFFKNLKNHYYLRKYRKSKSESLNLKIESIIKELNNFGKIQLIESSLYNMILFPTILFIMLLFI